MIKIYDIGFIMNDVIQISNHVYKDTLAVISNLTSEQTSGWLIERYIFQLTPRKGEIILATMTNKLSLNLLLAEDIEKTTNSHLDHEK